MKFQTVQTLTGCELYWNGEKVGSISSRDAAEDLRDILFLAPHLARASRQCLEIVKELQRVGFPPGIEQDSQFVVEANFLLDLIKAQEGVYESTKTG